MPVPPQKLSCRVLQPCLWVSCVESWLVVFSGFPGEMSLNESAKNYPLNTDCVVSSDLPNVAFLGPQPS